MGLGLVGNAVWAVSTLFGVAFDRPKGSRLSRKDRLSIGLFLLAMLVVSGLIFLVLFNRWVET